MDLLFEWPYTGVIIILLGFILSFFAGQIKVYGLYKKNIKTRILLAVITVVSYIFVAGGGIFIIIYNFKNPDLDSRDANIAGAFLLCLIALAIIFLIKYFTYRYYKKKYVEEERHNQMIAEVNLIMAEFPEKKFEKSSADAVVLSDSADISGNENTPVVEPEPELEPELSEEDEAFLLYLQNKYMKK